MTTRYKFVVALFLAAPLLAQEYRWEQVDDLGVKFRVHKKLKPLPLQLGSDDLGNLRVRFLPDNEGDFIFGTLGKYQWELYVYEFRGTKGPKDGPATGDEGAPKSKEEAEAEARQALADRRTAATFEDFVLNKDPSRNDRKFYEKGKAENGRGKAMMHKWWEYEDVNKVNQGGREAELIWYKSAAVVDLGDKEVALVVNLPVKKRGDLSGKYKQWVHTMLKSITPLKDSELGDGSADSDKDEWAQTDEQKAALEQAKNNIKNSPQWDYFTTPHYIVVYAFDLKSADKRRKAEKFARTLVDNVEEIRAKYEEFFPPHEKMANPYSVLRICSDYSEFLQYGSVSPGVVGFFSPASKELVMFYDADRRFGGEEYVVKVAFHEAWHQYADAYFGSMELHRWFDEGIGELFGSFDLKGKKWTYEALQGRYMDIRAQLQRSEHIPLREIVTWNKDKFYGANAPSYYAEGYSLIDFLYRGQNKLGRKWDEKWDGVIKRYTQAGLETNSQKKAVEAAFEGVDWDAIEEAWSTWVQKHMKASKDVPEPKL
jgi:hypothetical protein